MGGNNNAVLEVKGICKSFGGLQALKDVDLHLCTGEALGLVGDNGAGKSTLIKVFTGAYTADAGEIFFEGKRVAIKSPVDSRRLGIEAIYQDLALLPESDVKKNIFLGRELVTKFGILRKKKMEQESREVLQRVGITLKTTGTPVGLYSGGEQQAIAIARALYWDAQVLIMDEPTAAMAAAEKRKIYEIIENAKRNNLGIIIISHNLADIFAVCDRIQVLRLGKTVGVFDDVHNTSEEEVISLITGADSHRS